ncbi:MAG: HNH endonuclease, partial [Candidatus Pacearchaeota archaeon]|nr:HNH endonuclease [Candidatus Pacearchaeota archaeon]
TWIESAMIGICLAGLCHDKALDKLKTFSLMPNKEIAISLIEANKKKIFEIGVATRDIINIADSLNLERSKGWKEAKIDFNLISSNLVNRFAILEKYNFSCAYCGRRPPEVALELDHVFPKSKGGTNGSSNRVPACWECNHGKRDKILSEESTKLIKQVIESKDECY